MSALPPLFSEPAPHPVPLALQLSEVMREIGIRREFYARLVAARRMNRITAESQMHRMQAVADTLRRLIEEGRA